MNSVDKAAIGDTTVGITSPAAAKPLDRSPFTLFRLHFCRTEFILAKFYGIGPEISREPRDEPELCLRYRQRAAAATCGDLDHEIAARRHNCAKTRATASA